MTEKEIHENPGFGAIKKCKNTKYMVNKENDHE